MEKENAQLWWAQQLMNIWPALHVHVCNSRRKIKKKSLETTLLVLISPVAGRKEGVENELVVKSRENGLSIDSAKGCVYFIYFFLK